MVDGNNPEEESNDIADHSVEKDLAQNSLDISIEHSWYNFDVAQLVKDRMKVVSPDQIYTSADDDSICRILNPGNADNDKLKDIAVHKYIQGLSPIGKRAGLAEHYFANATENYQYAINDHLPYLKESAPKQAITITGERHGDELGHINIHNFSSVTITDEQIQGITMAIDFIYQSFGSKTYDLLKDIIISQADLDGNGMSGFNAYVSGETPGVIYLNSSNLQATMALSESSKFEPVNEDFSTELVIIHEFGHLIHNSNLENKPEALLEFAKATGWDIDSIPDYPKKGQTKESYFKQSESSGLPTEYSKTHPFETFADTTAMITASDEGSAKYANARDAWLNYLNEVGFQPPAAEIDRPKYVCSVQRIEERSINIPKTISVVAFNNLEEMFKSEQPNFRGFSK